MRLVSLKWAPCLSCARTVGHQSLGKDSQKLEHSAGTCWYLADIMSAGWGCASQGIVHVEM